MNNTDGTKGSAAGQGLGVAGFVLGVIALILSFIPCLGMYAIIPGVIAIIFSAVAFTQAASADAPRGLIIAALIISILGTSIAIFQLSSIRRATRGIGTEIRDAIKPDIGDEIRENIRKALEEAARTGTVPEGDTIDFDTESMIEELERLEKEEGKDTEELQEQGQKTEELP